MPLQRYWPTLGDLQAQTRLCDIDDDIHEHPHGARVTKPEPSNGINRLIMIAGAYRHWPLEEASCDAHEKFLRKLLRTDKPGLAWLATLDHVHRRKPVAVRPRSIESIAPEDDATEALLDPCEWSEGDAEVDSLVRDMKNRLQSHLSASVEQASIDVAFRPMRHRIFLDRTRFINVVTQSLRGGDQLGLPAQHDFYLCVDIRFGTFLSHTVCMVSISIWSGEPWSDHHRPPCVQPPRIAPSMPPDLPIADFARLFRAASDQMIHIVLREYAPAATPRVFGRPYRAPIFWLAVPQSRHDDPWNYLDQHDCLDVPRLSETFLGGATSGDCTIAVSAVRRTLILRRFSLVPGVEDEAPEYLLLPTEPSNQPGLPFYCAQEDSIRRAQAALTDIESRSGAALFDIETDLTIRRNHLHVFEHTVARAAEIWDGLATHLPTAHGRRLEQVHRSVELVHQSLLQGLADIDKVSSSISEVSARLDHFSSRLNDEYNARLLESHRHNRTSVCAAITQGGHFATIRQEAAEAQQLADRVTSIYRNLVGAITTAFDERRVRETDKLQKAGVALAAALGLVGLVTVLDTIVDAHLKLDGNARWGYVLPMIALGTSILLVYGWWVRQYWAIGRLVSPSYEQQHREVAAFLRLCSTGRLEHLQKVLEVRTPVRPEGEGATWEEISSYQNQREEFLSARWNWHDADLADRFAAVWDAIDCYWDKPGSPEALSGDSRVSEREDEPPEKRSRSEARGFVPSGSSGRVRTRQRRAVVRASREEARYDQERLHAMAEKWSLRTLLLTERPRDLYTFRLPRLTLMYRAAFILLGDPDVEAVTVTDLRLVLVRSGLDRRWIQGVDKWLHRAVEALDAEHGRRAQELRTTIDWLVDPATSRREIESLVTRYDPEWKLRHSS